VPAAGGVKAAKELKEAPKDGLTLGFMNTETMAYNRLASKNPGFGVDDFTYLTTTTGSQMTLYTKSGKGWKSVDDLLAAAKQERLKIGVMSQKLADATYVFGKANGVEFNIVSLNGAKGVMNAIVADDVDAGFGAGIQGKGVKAGDFVHLLNGETAPLRDAPQVPGFKAYGVPYDLGAKFMIVAPAGIPKDAATAITQAVIEIITDPKTKVHKMINNAFSGPQPITLDNLASLVRETNTQSEKLLNASAN
jgi:tripartite-type tricarboxylate transporter receptor subunit TctC